MGIQVPFHDLDPYEVVWHGHYVKYLELARDRLLEDLGCGRQAMRAAGYAWPVVDLRIQYVRPLRCGQRIRVRASLEDWEFRLRIRYQILDARSLERLSKGYTTQVAIDLGTGLMCQQSPAALADRLSAPPC